MSAIEQAARAVRLHTALPDNALALSAMTGSEQFSELFSYVIECVSEDASLELYEVLGKPICIEFDTQNDGLRYVHGIVRDAAHAGSRGEYALYQFTVTASAWMLTHTSDCRIFTDMSVPGIIESVLQDSGHQNFDNRLTGTYDIWNYCVQYQETDFDFICRLMEHEGIYFYFEHFEDRHVLVLCDEMSAHNRVPDYAEIPCFPVDDRINRESEHLTNWQFRREIRPGKFVTRDFAFDEPRRDLLVQDFAAPAGQYDVMEVYEFPGGFAYGDSGAMTRDYGERLARMRMEALTADHETATATGNVRGLGAGQLFTLCRCEREDQNREYLVVCASLRIQMDSYYSGEGGGAVELESALVCIPSDVPFRPVRKTLKPRIRGPQTAIVVGPAGEEIWTDQHGRVKLQFHWDRYGQADENSSCWIRVSQLWAGSGWGGIHVPRIGQEVIVEYIDGDPDRPVVTGRLYNGDRATPYGLPANATQSGIKSRSSTSGTASNFNEFRMEDKKGSEEIYLHAERNQTNIVENDEFTGIGHDRVEEVGNDETNSIGHDLTETIGNNKSIVVAANHTETVGANFDLNVGSSKSENIGAGSAETVAIGKLLTVGAAYQITVGAAMNTTVGGALAEEVLGLKSESICAAKSVSVAGSLSEDVGGSASANVGGDSSETVAGKRDITVKQDHTLKARKIRLEAEEEVVIKAGEARITMKSNGDIEISGANISVKGSKKIDIKATKDLTLKGKKIAQN